MEIVWGGFSGFLLLFSLYLAFAGGKRGQKATLVAVVIIEVLVALTVFMDWGYSWVDMSGLTIATERNIWILVPQFTAILVLVVLVGSGLRRSWLAFMLAVFQTPLILYTVYMVELDLDMSVFTPAAVICFGGSTAAATLLIPTVVRTIPIEGSPLWKLVFSGRAGILDGIQTLTREKGLNYTAPETLFESGSASGEQGKIHWDIQSRPSLWPPGYGLSMTLESENIQKPAEKPVLPGLMDCACTLEATDKKLHYSCVIRKTKSITKDNILGLAKSLEDLADMKTISV